MSVCFFLAKVDPCDSREDPVVCAALIDANAYIDLDDVLEAEKEFWKVISISANDNTTSPDRGTRYL